MNQAVDIKENEILEKYPEVLDILLKDHTTQKPIFWATDDYEYLGKGFQFNDPIRPELVTGDNGNIIMPRVKKDAVIQQARSRGMAEVFTPSWICNAQNNLIDEAWFGRDEVFNREIKTPNGGNGWEVCDEKIAFPDGKTWRDYVRDTRLEVACGEAPYITSRYDTTTGEFIPVNKRIGFLDRKLRVISENVHTSGEWLKAAQQAFKNTYGFEWQGDNLLLAREALLFTFLDFYREKFDAEPQQRSIKYMAYIISWNIWQMDGLKGVIPNSCGEVKITYENLFGEVSTNNSFCQGCLNNNILKHNGTYCLIKDWSKKDPKTGKSGIKIKFIDLLKNRGA